MSGCDNAAATLHQLSSSTTFTVVYMYILKPSHNFYNYHGCCHCSGTFAIVFEIQFDSTIFILKLRDLLVRLVLALI